MKLNNTDIIEQAYATQLNGMFGILDMGIGAAKSEDEKKEAIKRFERGFGILNQTKEIALKIVNGSSDPL
jgi:hypothetical protein